MKILSSLAASLLAIGFAVQAQPPQAPQANTASQAQSAEAIKAELKKRFPDAPIEAVRKVPFGNLYEVFGGGEIFYTDDKATYLLVGGSLIDAKTRENVTEASMRKLTAVKFDSLPIDQAVKIVRGNGSRKVAVFADPNCGYCKRFERDILAVNDITVYVFLYPILSPDSTEKSKAVWCSADRGKAWLDMMTKETAPSGGTKCETPIDKIVQFGRDKRIQGTPTLFFEDGERIGGAMTLAQFEKRLGEAKTAVSKAPIAKQ
jgi:thiol:disulfide interchange protein DsbC